ncbi:hypothetical protein HBI56_039960 [Parastagonospora nodorum]|uniref:Uncharacterized protein n=1 Tax=Phaeosphaeria nodorum (strain SN15 / ATCC MYA-4574 / FGSC 10173) TaxID=321614 RepID=A0A7U2EUL3_PHANO|nr:hypothetical protein HBH56_066810 [Parastagonospora nodorum]QRC93370.1 hypothetical protein JI435_403700 [Parastagonospora nodorum SN15]KAH3932357.1 hypothetical protein HBH54_081280 [Parastagonospora nodorum]KAH3955077.1 hypothetical protein HBH53_013100 [Parastagonospora nodorum]KAH3986200.1 hypothetical protein HBH52_044300 [Parastagonospora nodorum]
MLSLRRVLDSQCSCAAAKGSRSSQQPYDDRWSGRTPHAISNIDTSSPQHHRSLDCINPPPYTLETRRRPIRFGYGRKELDMPFLNSR